ncbi:NAD(P)-dependent alcohol dehydrogenase [Sphingobium amiense]|uniref:NAD(P)-dependent alcohol dehydrogenase n=1 Tax=Sphingobium amiense TaxID=135719 RepID=A0A494WCX1_9SPHN|nr:zinc-binding dehydrogenase [Sphingobium amiense]BBD98435.1 NAD(P)-dependent alcohol dehydrogenase [Sphingobium amiense]
MACDLGATHAIDAAEGDVTAAICALVPDGVEFALETSGREALVDAALASLGSHGMLGFVGVPPKPDNSIKINLAALITYGHRIIGIIEATATWTAPFPNWSPSTAQGGFRSTSSCEPIG